MATASELRGIIRPRHIEEAVPMAIQMAVGMFDRQQNEADKAVGKEMAKLAKRYVSVLQGITGLKDGWVVSPTSHLLSIDNEDGGVTIDIHWESDVGTGKVDVTVELNKRSGPEGRNAKWKSKFHLVKGLAPNATSLSPTNIITDAAVRRFLKEHAKELLSPLMEEDGWVIVEVNKYDIRRSEEAWKDAEAIADSYKEDGDPRERKARADAEKLKKDHDALMAKWEKQKKKSREYSRGRTGAMLSVGMVRTRSGRWEDTDQQVEPLDEAKMDPFAQKVRREFTGLMRSMPSVLQRASEGSIPWKVIAKEDLYGDDGLYMSIYCGEDAKVSMQKGVVTSPSGDPFVEVSQWGQGQDEFTVRVGLDYEESGTTEFIDETAVDSSKTIGILKRAPMEFTRWLKKHNFTFKMPEGVKVDIENAIAIIEDDDIVVMDHFLDALMERNGTFIDLTTVPTERDAMRLRKWVNETGKEAGRMMSNSMDPVYVLDPSMLLKDKTLGGLFKLAARDYLGRDVEMEKVRSPKTGQPGWRMSFAAGGENVAIGADARTAQLAFNKLKAALRKAKLPTSTGDMRKAEAGEFMLMNMADGNRKAMFKHGDTRNYVIVDMKSGKLDVPVTLKPFFRGQFDVYEEVEQPASVADGSAMAQLRGIIERRQRQHPKKDPELAKRVWNAIKGEGKTSAPGVLKVMLPSKVAVQAGVGNKASEVDLMRVPAQMLDRIAMAVGVTEGLEEAGNRKRLERAIYKAAGPSNRMVMRDVDGRKMKSTLAKGGQQYVMLTGDMAKALGQASYTNVALADLSDDDLRKLGSALGVAEGSDGAPEFDDTSEGKAAKAAWDDSDQILKSRFSEKKQRKLRDIEESMDNDIARLRSIIQEGKPRGPVKGGGKGYWSREEKKGELKKKERRSKRKEIAQQMKGEDVSLDDLGLFFELLADDYAVLDVDAIDEAMAVPMSGQMEALAKVLDTAEQLGRFATEFAGLLKRSMKKGQVDVRKMGEFGRRVDAAHSILQRSYRALASGLGESIEEAVKRGDKVRVTKGKQKGMTGTITAVGSGAKGDMVSVALDNPVQRMLGPAIMDPRHLVKESIEESPEWEVNLLEVDLTEFRVPTPADVSRKWLSDAVDALIKGIDRQLIYGGSGATVRPYGEGYMISAHKPDWVITIAPWKGETSTSPELKFWMGFDWNSRKPDIRDVKVGGKPGDAAKTFAKQVNTFVKRFA